MVVNEFNQIEQEAWDKKKIVVFIGALLLLAGGVVYGFQKQAETEQVKGLQSKDTQSQVQSEPLEFTPIPFTNFQQTFEDKIEEVKKEAQGINVAEVASSSPQIQKVINDIKNLQNYPRNQAKEACFNICEGL